MVKVGFICEGDTEKIIFDSPDFRNALTQLNVEVVDTINAEGYCNLLPENITDMEASLRQAGAEKILIITDLDKDACKTETKERVNPGNVYNHQIFIAVKAIESWFLADSSALSAICQEHQTFESPENEVDPFETIRQIRVNSIAGRGVGSKTILAKLMINNGYSILNSAAHPNCPSAKYLVDKLTQIGKQ